MSNKIDSQHINENYFWKYQFFFIYPLIQILVELNLNYPLTKQKKRVQSIEIVTLNAMMKAVISSHASEFPLWCKWIWYLIIVKQLSTALKCTGRVHMHRGNFNTSTNRPIREIISVITKQMISTSLKFRSTKNKNQRNCSVCISNTKNKTHAKNLRVHKVYHSNPLHT